MSHLAAQWLISKAVQQKTRLQSGEMDAVPLKRDISNSQILRDYLLNIVGRTNRNIVYERGEQEAYARFGCSQILIGPNWLVYEL